MTPEAKPLQVTSARDLSPLSGSLTILAGPPGLGKSWLAGSVAEYLSPKEVLVLATLPREVNSLQYQKHNLDTVVCADEEWQPEAKSLKATGYDNLIDTLRALRSDEKYGAIIIDNGTEAAELAWHAVLAPLGIGDPNELGKGGNRFAPYTSLREKMETMIRACGTLTGKTGLAKRPKLIIIPWHVQPPKDGMGDDESGDEKGKGAEYEGEYLPMIRGAFRRRLMALVDNFVYADLVRVPGRNALSESENHFCIQVISDNEKHVKTGGVTPALDKLVAKKYLDVHDRHDGWRVFTDLLKAEKK